jgi:hypothetical protein
MTSNWIYESTFEKAQWEPHFSLSNPWTLAGEIHGYLKRKKLKRKK